MARPATTVPTRRWRGRPNACAATAVSFCRWRDRWARCSGYAATNCPPTGMSSTSSTAAAPTPTLRLRRAPARRCMSPTTTASSTSWRHRRSLRQSQRHRGRRNRGSRWNRRNLPTSQRRRSRCGFGARSRIVGACGGVARIACAIRCRGTYSIPDCAPRAPRRAPASCNKKMLVPSTPVPSPASVTGRQLSRAGTRNAAAAATSHPSAPITMNGHARAAPAVAVAVRGSGQVRHSSDQSNPAAKSRGGLEAGASPAAASPREICCARANAPEVRPSPFHVPISRVPM